MAEANELTAGMAHRAESIVEFDMRVAFVGHELAKMDALTAVQVIAIAHQRAVSGHMRYRDLLLAISVHLMQPRSGDLKARLVRVAVVAGLGEGLGIHEGDGGPGAEGAEPTEGRIPDFGLGRPVTLGERKTLARTTNRDMLLRVIRDPHPDVIEILLGNPHLTEPDVVRLCARRPISPEVLLQVFRHPRWVRHYRIRLTILRNPFCSRELALLLVPHLRRQDAAEVGASPELDPVIRARCLNQERDVTVH